MVKSRLLKILLFTSIVIAIVMNLPTYAANGSMSVHAKSTSLNVGDTTTLTVTANNSMIFYKISSSDSSVVSVNASSGEIDSDEGSSKSASYTLTAKKLGTATITVSTYDASDYDANSFSSTKTVTITVKEKEVVSSSVASNGTTTTTNTKSSDATLKSITVGGKKYTNPGTTVTASNASASTSSVKIIAETNNSKAKVTGTGTKDLVTGTNKFNLKVTAEDGTTKTYTVKVTKLAEENQTPNVIENSSSVQKENKEEIVLKLIKLEIEGITISPEFKEEVYEYTANIGNVESLNIKAVANEEKAKIEISGNENLVEGENTIYISLTLDSQTITYKITANKAVGLTNIDSEDKEKNNSEENKTEEKVNFIGSVKNWWNNGGYLVTIFVIIWIIMGIAIIYALIAYKYAKILREEYGHEFVKNKLEGQYNAYDLEEDIETEKQELDEWYSKPENNIENTINKGGKHF